MERAMEFWRRNKKEHRRTQKKGKEHSLTKQSSTDTGLKLEQKRERRCSCWWSIRYTSQLTT